jgi:hypothetical protein
MRTFALFLFACALTTTVYARAFPKDGNDLLEYCSVMVDSADNPSYLQSLSGDKFTEKLAQFDWCAGYIQGTEDVFEDNFINLGLLSMAGLKFDGPEKLQSYALATFRGPCFPGNAPILQLARVLVKWLRDHPARLHELKITLTIQAFRDSFPCEQTPSKEATKPAPAPVKP